MVCNNQEGVVHKPLKCKYKSRTFRLKSSRDCKGIWSVLLENYRLSHSFTASHGMRALLLLVLQCILISYYGAVDTTTQVFTSAITATSSQVVETTTPVSTSTITASPSYAVDTTTFSTTKTTPPKPPDITTTTTATVALPRPVTTRCVIQGDPHYMTFDGLYYDFMGACIYTTAKLCNISSLPHFNVETKNEHRGYPSVSYVRDVHVDVYGHRVTLSLQHALLLDGERVTPPLVLPGMHVSLSGSYLVLMTNFSLTVRFDGNHQVEVSVPMEYAGQLCGLCGNFNGDAGDDYLMSDGMVAASSTELGSSWISDNSSADCVIDFEPPVPCDAGEQAKFESEEFCGKIHDVNGAFQECHAVVNPEQFFITCVLDQCWMDGNEQFLCASMQTYADQCAQHGVIVMWRNDTFCPLECPADSHYESCAPSCPATCSNVTLPGACQQPCGEGCVCDEGFVLSGDKCVPQDQCGCMDHNDFYHPLGDSWFATQNCSLHCSCGAAGGVVCEPWQCGASENCSVQNGIFGCHNVAVDTTPSTIPQTIPPLHLGVHWTQWFDHDNPHEIGDFETVKTLREEYPQQICSNPIIIEARTLDGILAEATGQVFYSNSTYGFQCFNHLQVDGKCHDYKVRFLCWDYDGHWTQWFDRDSPTEDGDFETLQWLRHEYPDQICPRPVEIEVMTLDGVPVELTAEVTFSNATYGFECFNHLQANNQCHDYQVRFLCGKRDITAAPSGAPSSAARCLVTGDPHYTTFDGLFYDFMGACIYTTAKLCNIYSSLPHFNVETKNQRASPSISVLQDVYVDVYGHRITMTARDTLLLDGERVTPPLVLPGMHVSLSGSYLVLMTNFSLTVRLGWNNQVEVSVPMDYAGQLCGLCGNFNGDIEDDFLMPNGSLAASETKLGNSWISDNSSADCDVDVEPPGPCDAEEQAKFESEEFCGKIHYVNGAFQECHAVVNPEQFFITCVLDQCWMDGIEQFLCDSMQTYADQCAQHGVIVMWRNDTFCPLECPADSHYESCAPPCPATCSNVTLPGACQQPCGEGCVCDEGFVLSGDKCVPQDQCGCLDHNDFYHPLGDSWFATQNCSLHCSCGDAGGVVCEPWQCGAFEICSVQNGSLGCHSNDITTAAPSTAPSSGAAKCLAMGDPHYTTFDGLYYHFMGACIYTTAKLCNISSSLPHFNVETKNDRRGSTSVSYVRDVHVDVYGHRVTLSLQHALLLDGERVTPPLVLPGMHVSLSGSYLVLMTNFSLTVRFDGNHQVEVSVPMEYAGQLCGLCGNFNGDIEDDLLMPNGSLAASETKLGNSWISDNSSADCDVDFEPPGPCDAEEQAKFESEEFCGKIHDVNGAFKECHAVVNPEQFFITCVLDQCWMDGNEQFLCASMQTYADQCAQHGVIIMWRNDTFCPLECPADSHYESCAPPCPATCSNVTLPGACQQPCGEGCVCEEGFVLSGDKCVPQDQCGCLDHNDFYHPLGDSWFATQNCSLHCTCGNAGGVVCEPWQCGVSEICSVQNGSLGCHSYDTTTVSPPTTTAPPSIMPGNCIVHGDPHYVTFDGLSLAFMGTCTYTTAKLCNSSSHLPYFNVETTNEYRNQGSISFVREVHTEVYGQNITLSLGRTLLLNEELVTPPLVLPGLHVSLSGSYLVLMTDFNLIVRFNGDNRAEVTVPREYAGELCGICGNFNGDRADEYLMPDGTQASSPTELGNSWKTDNSSAYCDAPPPPPCDEDEQAEFETETFCGIITDVNGLFTECHAVVNPEELFTSCVLDQCWTHGDKGTLCGSLQAYADECAENGIVIMWRNTTFCPLECPADSHYESCAPPCPATCSNVTLPGACQQPCGEGCVCEEGFVLSGDKCVTQDQCGCMDHNEFYHPLGDSWFATQNCSLHCSCGDAGGVVCEPWQCGASEICSVQNGSLGCHSYDTTTVSPPATTAPPSIIAARCVVQGDPHYTTFDGLYYDFMGACIYTTAKLCNISSSLPHFNVETKNQRASPSISVLQDVYVDVFGHRITMTTHHILLLDGERVTPPLVLPGMHVSLSGSYLVLMTNFSLTVRLGGNSQVEVSVPMEYAGQLCGLCGNCNGDIEDDLLMPNGSLAASETKLGNSWISDNSSADCDVDFEPPGPCDAEEQAKFESEEFCGKIHDVNGAFQECHAVVNPEQFFITCVLDQCWMDGNEQFLCASMQTYADQCAQHGVIIMWRNDTFCPLECPADSHYESCAPPCPATCSNVTLPGACQQPCGEGCVCDEGFVFSGDKCVPQDQCGCMDHNDLYHPLGDSWFATQNCSLHCTCGDAGGVVCEPWQCGASEICSVQNGSLGCHSYDTTTISPPTTTAPPSIMPGNCIVHGDPHYVTFDGLSLAFMGTCTYTTAKLCNSSSHLPYFNVETTNEYRNQGSISFVREVHTEVYGQNITLSLGRTLLLNEELVTPPLVLPGLHVSLSGSYLVLMTDFNLIVRFNGDNRAEVTVPREYAGELCGICGNFNGDRADEYLMPDGTQASSPTELGNSWKTDNSSAYCDAPPPPPCDEDEQAEFETEAFCGIITDVNGLFTECHAVVNPEELFTSCVLDQCWTHGDKGTLCGSLQAYADECAENGIVIMWRNTTFCPLECPADSHYESCAPPCPATCSNVTLPGACQQPCGEGCVCDEGFVLSGDKCVPQDQCGCMDHNEFYHPLGDSWFATQNCSLHCSCGDAGGVVCEPWQCGASEICSVQNGSLGCHSYDTTTVSPPATTAPPSIIAARCVVQGDPHYTTFDGLYYDFMGACIYTTAKLCNISSSLPHFNVETKNQRASPSISVLQDVYVDVFGHRITMTTHHILLLDGERVTPPLVLPGMHVSLSGSYLVLMTNFSLTVRLGGNSQVEVSVPMEYAGQLCGLCGNCNGDIEDDLLMPNGSLAASETKLGNSWISDNSSADCDVDFEPPGPCDAEEQAKFESEEFCGKIHDVNGAFQECHAVVNPEQFFITCVLDQCWMDGNEQFLCASMQTYADQCAQHGVIIMWRNDTFCPLECPADSHYESCAPPCPATCSNVTLPGACQQPCGEGCVCDEGFVFSGDKCVPQDQCGCMDHNDLYHPLGDSWFATQNCSLHCSCGDAGGVVCEPWQCGASEICSVQNGSLGCHSYDTTTVSPPTTTAPPSIIAARCVVQGDPHYTTFDGLYYDFMGACIYTTAKLCNISSSLPHFNVETKNERFNPSISVLQDVYVDVFGHRITMTTHHILLLDGERVTPPLVLPGMHVSLSGSYLVLMTNFSLTVRFDGYYQVVVSVPMDYAGQLCGLCGNFNGDIADDLLMPNGSLAASETKLGNSWISDNSSADCDVDFEPPGPCDAEEQAKFESEEFCGKIHDVNGAFQECHAVVNPEQFFITCVLDQCWMDGNEQFLCASMQTYADQCAQHGVIIMWRNDTFCPLECPADSHYESCAPPCPATCSNVTLPGACQQPCGEGCVCDEGFVFSGDKCVPQDQCGCMDHNDLYHPLGDSWFATQNCSLHCSCGDAGGVVCEPWQCGASEICSVQNGSLGCHSYDTTTISPPTTTAPPSIMPGNCIVHGDPHYVTFDGLSLAFMGTCTYTTAKLCNSSSHLPYFNVETTNEYRNQGSISFVREVHTEVYGQNITLSLGRTLLLNEELVTPPLVLPGLHVSLSGSYLVLMTDFNLIVRFNGDNRAEVTVPREYAGELCGICGNFNGDRADEYLMPDGTQASSPTELGNSWKTDNSSAYCDAPPPPPCDEDEQAEFETEAFCGIITDVNGLFKECHAVVNPEELFTSCVLDQCWTHGDKGTLCGSLQAYADECAENGIVIMWRNGTFCPLECPADSHYESCAPPCPATCSNVTLPGACQQPCGEGCVCDEGFVFSGDKCVLQDQCGCLDHNDLYHPLGDHWFGTQNCSLHCSCVSVGDVVCDPWQCGAYEICNVQNGTLGCHDIETSSSPSTCIPAPKPEPHLSCDFDDEESPLCSWVQLSADAADWIRHSGETPNPYTGPSGDHTTGSTSYIYSDSITLVSRGAVRLQSPSINSHQNICLSFWYHMSGDNLMTLNVYVLDDDIETHVWNVVGQQSSAWLQGSITIQAAASSQIIIEGVSGYTKSSDIALDDIMVIAGKCAVCVSGCDFDKNEGLCQWRNSEEDDGDWELWLGQTDTEGTGPDDDFTRPGFGNYLLLDSYYTSPGDRLQLESPLLTSPGCLVLRFHYYMFGTAADMAINVYVKKGGLTGPAVWSLRGNQGKAWILAEIMYSETGEVQFLVEGVRGHTDGSDIALDNFCVKVCDPRDICSTTPTPPPPVSATCHVAGDPHYFTFDSALITYMGTCTYQLVSVCNADHVTPFTILAKNEERGQPNASYLKQVYVDIGSDRIQLKKKNVILLNGKKVKTPIIKSLVPGVQFSIIGSYVHVVTDFGLVIKFDGVHHLSITLPSAYANKVCGLCGNYNLNHTDDLLMPNGWLASDNSELGNSWNVEDADDKDCKLGVEPVQSTWRHEKSFNKRCQVLTSPTGPFASCHHVINPQDYVTTCTFDMGQYSDMASILCDSLQAYAEACRVEGVNIQWRNETFCPLSCLANSHYTDCASLCPNTCLHASTEGDCRSTEACTEGCVCDSGFVLSDRLCVPQQDCGCWDHGNIYHTLGESWLTDNCSTRCRCMGPEDMDCNLHSCMAEESCALQNGQYKCQPVGFSTCTISGDPHYQTFDGLPYNFMGNNTYVLVQTSGDNPNLIPISVRGKNANRHGLSDISYLDEVHVNVFGHEIRFTSRDDFEFDGVRMRPPMFPREGLSIQQSSHRIILQTDFGLTVIYDRREHADVIISSSYMNEVSGLCGNYNGDPNDEYFGRNGQQIPSIKAFGESWAMNGASENLAPAVSQYKFSISEDPLNDPTCSETQLIELQGISSCGMIKDIAGPFQPCQETVSPDSYYENCLYDMCANFGDKETLCNSLAVYTASCQRKGITPSNWRNFSGCDAACPPNSIYTESMNACPASCGNLAAPEECGLPRMEGCQCELGFVWSGFHCVPFRDCGCFHDDTYYEVGNEFYSPQCSSRCQCVNTDTVICRNKGCNAEEVCSISNYTFGCFNLDACDSSPCLNGGTCTDNGRDFECHCPPTHSGIVCEHPGNTPPLNTVTIVIIVVCTVGGIILISVTIVLVRFRHGRKHMKLEEVYDTKSSASSEDGNFNYRHEDVVNSDVWAAYIKTNDTGILKVPDITSSAF
ncbi:IgGFc-binding protein-like isoform X2 [Lampetra planeri]